MNIIKTSIEGPLILEPRIFRDDRGYFFESFSQRTLMKRYAKSISYRTMKANRLTE